MFTAKKDALDAYQRDGVVHLQQVFEPNWLQLLSAGLKKNLNRPSARFEERTVVGSTSRYCEDFWVWSEFEEFEHFIRASPAAEIGAAFMAAQRINLVMDNWFVREPGAAARAPWHHDISYFDFDGTMCVLWIPLEPVKKGEGIELVRGSHLWNTLFMRVWFDDHQAAEPSGWVNGQRYESPPDINSNRDEFDIVSFDMDAGDCLIFDIRTLHGSNPNFVPSTLSRRYTLRLAAENARIRYRGDWAKNERALFEAAGHRDGDEMNSEFFPELWPRTL
ncbi:MAG: phytanoyl-CoA dioxygenase family protein [Pseudomonadales bacterium]